MDQMLKNRQLSSASARKRRIQERQDQRDLAFKRYEDYRRKILYQQEEESEDSEYSEEEDEERSVQHYDRESSVETPSECSAVTPEDSPAGYNAFDQPAIADMASMMSHAIHIERLGDKSHYDVPIIKAPLSPRLNLQASITSVADFDYNRFSAVPDYASDYASVDDLDTDLDEPYTPIETARPIAFCLPKVRPAVVRITTGSQRKKRPISTQGRSSPVDLVSHGQTPSSSSHLSQMGFLACEATPFEIPDTPISAISMPDHKDYENTSLATMTQLDRMISKKVHANALPATKTRSSKISAIKTFIRSPSQVNFATKTDSPNLANRPPLSATHIMNETLSVETRPVSPHDSSLVMHRPRTTSIQPARDLTQAKNEQAPVISRRALPTTTTNREEADTDAIHKKNMAMIKKRREEFNHAFKSSSRHPHGAQFDVQRNPISRTPQTGFSNNDFDFSSRNLNTTSRRSGALFTSFTPSTSTFNQPVGLGLKI